MQHLYGNESYHIPVLIVLVLDDEDHVEAGQDGGHEVDVLLALRVIPSTKHTICSRQNRAARVQCRRYASLEKQIQHWFDFLHCFFIIPGPLIIKIILQILQETL
jgi:hypothetical protein